MTSETLSKRRKTQLHSDASKPPALSQRSGSSPPSAASLSTRKDYASGQTPPRVSPCLRTACSSDAPTPTVAQLAAYQPPRARYLPPPRACRPGQPPWCSSFLRAALGGRRAAPVEPRRGALRCSSLNASAPLPHLSLPTNSPTSRRDVDCHTASGRGNVTVRACLILYAQHAASRRAFSADGERDGERVARLLAYASTDVQRNVGMPRRRVAALRAPRRRS